MKAVIMRSPGRVELTEVPWPEVKDPGDAVVRVTRAAICGTDLHPYRGDLPDFRPDTIMGHEFVGTVDEVGPAVTIEPGTRVVASGVIACGACWWCRHTYHYQCEQVALFGYGDVVGYYVPGGQAEAVRVPFADTVLFPVPEPVSDDDAIFVGDVLTTGWTAVTEAGVEEGDVVAVVGCGPVGLCAAMSARLRGAAQVVGVDPNATRRRAADSLGLLSAPPDHARAVVHDLTGGRGADVVLEAVGGPAPLTMALDLVRARGVVVAVGAPHGPAFPLDTGDAFGRELTLRWVVGDPIRWRETLCDHLANGRLQPSSLVSRRLPLDEIETAYALFDRGEVIKVLLTPGPSPDASDIRQTEASS